MNWNSLSLLEPIYDELLELIGKYPKLSLRYNITNYYKHLICIRIERYVVLEEAETFLDSISV